MPPAPFMGQTNSDLAFTGNYVIQGNYAGPLVWDISNPAKPVLTKTDLCPASQNDVSVYKHLMIMSNESNSGRLDCGGGGIQDTVSAERLRGIRIFDIRDINNPKYVANVQTCRGSHTHTIVTDPEDPDTFYIYISGQAGVRSPNELAGCSDRPLSRGSEVVVVPDRGDQGAGGAVPRRQQSSARRESSTTSLHRRSTVRVPTTCWRSRTHGALARSSRWSVARRSCCPPQFVAPMLDSVVKARNGTGSPTAADSAAFRAYLPKLIASLVGGGETPSGPDQCHDITVYPAIGLAGGACGGYGLLLDISNPANPVRIGAVADSNFSYWHSATFNNDGTKVLFTDEWGGGGAPKCRATDKPEWGANAIFTLEDGKLMFKSYYKIPAAQTALENCVAHNGSLIPIPGRDVMVQAWYQGGISVFDWTDAAKPVEIAYFDRGPVDSTRFTMGGSWSVYWYNGVIVSSEIARGLDIFELVPSAYLTQNEIDAAKTVRFDQFNAQNQPKFTWPRDVLAGPGVCRPARAHQGVQGLDDRHDADRAGAGGEAFAVAAEAGADRAGRPPQPRRTGRTGA